MRELKFRMFDSAEKQFMSGSRILESRISELNTHERWMYQQWTGLKDKNGKEIYEGDIVKQSFTAIIRTDYDPVSLGFIEQEVYEGVHIGEVSFIASKGVCIKNPLLYEYDGEIPVKTKQYKPVASYRCEVIGNVYENPELLEGNHD